MTAVANTPVSRNTSGAAKFVAWLCEELKILSQFSKGEQRDILPELLAQVFPNHVEIHVVVPKTWRTIRFS